MKKIIALVVSAMLILSFGIIGNAATSTMPAKKTVKVGFIYVGPVGDGGYTFAHNQGRLFLEKTLKVKTIILESIKEDPVEVQKACDRLVDQGVNVIFGTSFGFMDGMVKAAKKYPDVVFMHCSGYKLNDTNMGNYFGRMEQPRYLSGIAAGLKTKTNKLGYVAAFEIPECIRQINAFTLGAQSVNPKVQVVVKWTHTWYDPMKEKEAAKALLDQDGVDVIAQHQDTAGPMQAAQDKGKFAIGFNTDAAKVVPKAYITAPIWNWGPYYVKVVKQVMAGTWKPTSYWGGMQDGIIKLAPLTKNAAPGTAAKIAAAQKKILAKPNMEFAGPIYDQAGKLRVAKGKVLSDAEQLSLDMNWFVKGVIGKAK